MKDEGPGTTAVHGRREAPRGPLAAVCAAARERGRAVFLIADVEQTLAAEQGRC